MRNKIIVLFVIVVVILGGFFFLSKNSNNVDEVKNDVVNDVSDKKVENNVSPIVDRLKVDVPSVVPDSYTLTEIATHNNEADCFTTVDGFVYDVTSWIPNHPGGKKAIISLCGKDGSSAFSNQHGGQQRPATELAKFKIGTLK